MVKTCIVLAAVLCFAAPVFAQDFSRLEVGFGYGNVGFTGLSTADLVNAGVTGVAGADTGRHSGFAMDVTFNRSESLGFQGYIGNYGLGSDFSLLTFVPGGKLTFRKYEKFAPYATGGFGFSRVSYLGFGQGTFSTARYGVGVDVPVNDMIGIKFDVSRMAFHGNPIIPNAPWHTETNIAVTAFLRLLN